MSNIYEYTNSYNNVMSSYANLEKYNKAASFGPKLPPTVPSSHFPTILQQKPIASYDVLTHHTESQYPNVSKAYGDSCKQKYMVRKCPTNQQIRPFQDGSVGNLTPAPMKCGVPTEEIVEGFHDLKSLDVLMFVDMSGKCKFSEKIMMESQSLLPHLKEVIDIAKPQNVQMFTNYGGYATPFFYSLKTNKSVTGFVSVEKLVDMLSSHESYEPDMKKKVRDMKLKVFVMNMCGYCQKLKEMMKSHGITEDDVEFIHNLEPYKHELKHVRGFPHTKSMATGKEMTGCPSSMEDLMKKLE